MIDDYLAANYRYNPGALLTTEEVINDINSSLGLNLIVNSAQVNVKPTLIDLLCRFYNLDANSIRTRVQNKPYMRASKIANAEEREQDKRERELKAGQRQAVALKMPGDLVPSTSGLGSFGRAATEQPNFQVNQYFQQTINVQQTNSVDAQLHQKVMNTALETMKQQNIAGDQNLQFQANQQAFIAQLRSQVNQLLDDKQQAQIIRDLEVENRQLKDQLFRREATEFLNAIVKDAGVDEIDFVPDPVAVGAALQDAPEKAAVVPANKKQK